MPHNLPSQDPRKIWQTQPKEQSREQPKMTLETIRLKASQLKAQTCQQVLANTAIACFVVVLSTVALWRRRNRPTAHLCNRDHLGLGRTISAALPYLANHPPRRRG